MNVPFSLLLSDSITLLLRGLPVIFLGVGDVIQRHILASEREEASAAPRVLRLPSAWPLMLVALFGVVQDVLLIITLSLDPILRAVLPLVVTSGVLAFLMTLLLIFWRPSGANAFILSGLLLSLVMGLNVSRTSQQITLILTGAGSPLGESTLFRSDLADYLQTVSSSFVIVWFAILISLWAYRRL